MTEVGTGALELVARFRSDAADRIRQANALSEQAGLKTGEALKAIVDHAGWLTTRVQALRTATSTNADISVAFQAQGHATSEYLRDIGRSVAAQSEAVQHAVVKSQVSRVFSASLGTSLAGFEQALLSLRSDLGELVAHADEKMQGIVLQSHSALSALQVIDPVAQSMLGLDRLAYDLEHAVAKQLQLPPPETPPPAIANISGTELLGAANAGELVLFD